MQNKQAIQFMTIAAGFVLTQLSLLLYLPSQKLIADAIGLSSEEMAYALSTALCGYALGQLCWGTLSDYLGRKPALIIAALGGAITAAVIPQCHSASNFDLLMACLTFFQAAYTSIGYSLIYDTFPAERTAKIIASIGILMAITPVIAPLLSFAITDRYGWTMLFTSLSVYSLVLMCAILWIIKHRPMPSFQTKGSGALTQLRNNHDYLIYCITLAFVYSAFILFQQKAPDFFANILHVPQQNYAFIYAIAALPYLLSTMVVKKLIQRYPIAQIVRIGSFLLASGYTLISCASLIQHLWLSEILGWTGILISMTGTGAVMPCSKIGAITSVNSHVGTASSGMKFIQIGTSIGAAWCAATLMATVGPVSSLSLLALCGIMAAWINRRSALIPFHPHQ